MRHITIRVCRSSGRTNNPVARHFSVLSRHFLPSTASGKAQNRSMRRNPRRLSWQEVDEGGRRWAPLGMYLKKRHEQTATGERMCRGTPSRLWDANAQICLVTSTLPLLYTIERTYEWSPSIATGIGFDSAPVALLCSGFMIRRIEGGLGAGIWPERAMKCMHTVYHNIP